MSNTFLQQYSGNQHILHNAMQFTQTVRKVTSRQIALAVSFLIDKKANMADLPQCDWDFYVFGPSPPKENKNILNIWMDTPNFSVDLYLYLYEGCFCLCIYLYSHNSRHTEISTQSCGILNLDFCSNITIIENQKYFWNRGVSLTITGIGLKGKNQPGFQFSSSCMNEILRKNLRQTKSQSHTEKRYDRSLEGKCKL